MTKNEIKQCAVRRLDDVLKYLELVGASLSLLKLLFSGLKILLIFCWSFGLLLLASEPFVLDGGGGCFLIGVLFLGAGFFCPFLGEAAAGGVFLAGAGLLACLEAGTFAGFFFLFSSFFFTGDESAELELVLEALVRAPFFWAKDLFAEAWELSVSELLLESLSDEEDDEELLLLLLLELESSVVLA